jgi:hypothetical protein
MNKIYSLMILLSAVSLTTLAQPTVAPAARSCNANGCATNSTIDVCPPIGSTVISAHTGGAYSSGNNGNHLGVGAKWRFRNMATVGSTTVNAEITIDAIYNATLDNMDDDNALDENNTSINGYFAPRIGPDANLNGSNRRGYVQFTMSFYRNSAGVNNNTNADFANSVGLNNINLVHYDVDGNAANNTNSGTSGSWFRETGVARQISQYNPVIVGDASTELASYTYADGGFNWAGFAGSVCEREGISKCAQITSSFSYNGSLTSITFRLGYDYNAGSNGGRPIRQYGTRIGCFNFPQQMTLPVKLLGFGGTYINNQTLLNWETENEVNFDHYEVERSTNGKDFIAMNSVLAKTGTAKPKYQYTDDLATVNENIFYYRLRMVDIDGKYNYSNVIMVRRDQKSMIGVLLSPNPITSSAPLTVRVSSGSRKNVEIRVIDGLGKLILKQQNQLSEGINSIAVSQLNRLQPGIYTIQVVGEEEVLSSKLSVIR